MRKLSASGLTVRLQSRAVLDQVDFSVAGGELVGILGANGAGKSTLLKSLMGLQPLVAGEVRLDGEPLAHWTASARARRLAYLAQGHVAHWPLSVREVVALGRLPHPRSASDEAVVERVLRQTDLAALADRNVLTLSGGERARTMLARALAVCPQVLLADEPLAALDPAHQLSIMQLLRAEAAAGLGVAIVLHDLPLAARFCSRVVLLHEGRVWGDGIPAGVLDDRALQEVFGIEAARFTRSGETVPLPWQLARR